MSNYITVLLVYTDHMYLILDRRDNTRHLVSYVELIQY
jgi:hypothetical protein